MEKSYCYGCMEQIEPGLDQCPECGFRLSEYVTEPHQLMPGTLLRERYAVGKVLGEGGFGITYVGRDTVLDIKVAIKEFYMSGYVNRNNTCSTIVQANTGTHGETFMKNRERFLTEARVLAKFANEEGIVGIRDFFQENNTAYIVMDFLSGETLRSHIERCGKLPGERVVQILEPVLHSLGNVHDHDVIHRDISPDNIMLTADGKVKLLDFGAARQVSKTDIKSLSIILKPGYAPEEQYRSKGKQGPWTDIYALCATMYRCITGITPDDAMERMFDDKLVHPAQLDCDCSKALGNVIMKGLMVRMTERYASISELMEDLARAAASPDDDSIAAPVSAAADEQRTVYVGAAQVPVSSATAKTGGYTLDPDSTVYAGRIDGPTVPAVQPEPVKEKPVKAKPEKPGKEKPVKEKPIKKELSGGKKGKKKVGRILGIAAAVVVAVVVVAIFGMGNGGKKNATMPARFANYDIELNGKSVSIPTSFAQMEEIGWQYQNVAELEAVLTPGRTSSSFYLTDGYGQVTVYFHNPTDSTLAIKDCPIYRLAISEYSYDSSYTGESVNTIKIPGGYSFGQTTEKNFKKTAPSGYVFEASSGTKYYSYLNATDGVEDLYRMMFRDGELREVIIENRDYSKIDVDAYALEAPAYDEEALKSYIDAELSFTVDGYEYGVPLTVQDYIDMGYVVERAVEYVPSYHTTKVYLRADTFNTLVVEVVNPFRTALATNACFVANVGTYDMDTSSKEPIVLHGTLFGSEISIAEGKVLSNVRKNLQNELESAGIYYDDDGKQFKIYHPESGSEMVTFTLNDDEKVTGMRVNMVDVLKKYFQGLGL